MKRSKYSNILLPVLLCAAFFIYWLVRHYLYRDLAWDEIVSLKNFVLVDFITSVTHYPDVNNHILFNLLNNLYCRMVGINDVYEAMDNPALAHLFTVAFTVLTLLYVYLAATKFISPSAGFLAVIILLTTIPFLNFTIQLRGYSSGMTFMAMSVYYIWSYQSKGSKLSAFMTAISIFGLLYSIPSNVYFALALAIAFTIGGILDIRKTGGINQNGISGLLKNKNFQIVMLIAVGSLLSLAAYYPILENLQNEKHLQELQGKSHYQHTLTKILPYVLHYILSYRFLLLIPLIASFLIFIRKRKEGSPNDSRYAILVSIIIISFIISLVRGDKPHQRTFTPLTVVFSLLAAGCAAQYFQGLIKSAARELIAFLIVFTYCIASFFFCNYLIQTSLNKAIIRGEMVYNMFYNFYQSDQFNLKYLDELVKEAGTTGYPIIMAKEIDRVAEGEYLMKNNLKYYSTVWARPGTSEDGKSMQYQVLLEEGKGKGAEPLYSRIGFPATIRHESAMFIPLFSYLYQNKVIDNEKPKFYVLTYAPRWLEGVIQTSMPGFTFKRMNARLNYHNVYLVSAN